MVQRQAQIAKITRPTLPAVLPRERLFRLLDEKSHSQVTWISGPPGSGKTTLVASYLESRELPCIWYQVDAGDSDIATFFYYMALAAKKAAPRTRKPLPLLTPEYLLDVPTFSQRFFENLCGRLRPPFYMVFDNYQEVHAGSPFHETLRAGLSAMPEDVHAVIISRAESPSAFAGMLAGNTLDVIGGEELRLTAEESRGIVLLLGASRQQNDMTQWIHDKTDGWAAGLILIAKALKREAVDPQIVNVISLENIFGYFANELFDKRTDEATKDFLLKTAILPKMTPFLAEQLTGNKDAGRILSELNRRNYFTEKRLSPALNYQYHPLFKEFLMARAKNAFSPADTALLQMTGARLLEKAGQIEDAAEQFFKVEGWAELARLIPANAQTMITQGRHGALREWIERLPQSERDKMPSVLYWHAHCLMPVQPDESGNLLERAFTLFRQQQDRTGMFLSLCSASDMSLQEGSFGYLDRQSALLNGMLREDPTFPSPEIGEQVTISMFNALAMRQPWNVSRNSWEKQAFARLRQSRNKSLRIYAGVYLATFHFYMGNMALAATMVHLLREEVRSGDISPLLMLTVKTCEAIHNYVAADFDSALKAVAEGLRLAEETGVHIWDNHLVGHGCGAALSAGDPDMAEGFLRRMISIRPLTRRFDKAYYHFLSAWHALATRDLDRAIAQINLLSELIPSLGFPFGEFACHVLAAQILHERGEREQASKFLELSKRAARRIGSTWLTCTALFADAQISFGRAETAGNRAAQIAFSRRGTNCLRKALAVCREQGIRNIYGWRKDVMASLFSRALTSGIEVQYVRELIRTRNLVPTGPDTYVEDWPWPVRIYTLGRFDLLIDEKPVSFSGKIQKKPLDMLKALIAFGGSGVSKERITDALWPGAEGDHAHRSFEMTLQRLRRMLGRDETVKLHGGHVSLDERFCWTDARAFGQAVQRAETASQDEASAGRNGPGRSGRAAGGGRRRTARRKQPDKTSELFEKAIALYQGPFLPSDSRQSWSIAMRERLRSRFIRLIGAAGERLEHAEDWAGAADLYEKCLEIDGLAEEFYQRLMHCHRRLGQEAQAVMVYHRCKKALLRNFGITPSSKTEAIYQQVLRARR